MSRFVSARARALLLFVGVALAGCGGGLLFSEARALPLATISIETVGGRVPFQVEVAADAQSQEAGLMYRKEMPPNAGMLFDMHKPQFLSFWMKNTYIPLDIVFVRADGTISSIEPNAIPLSHDSILSHEPVIAVIELNGGRAHQLGILPGARIHGSIFGSQCRILTG